MKKIIVKGNNVDVEFTCDNCSTVYSSNEYKEDVIKTFDKEGGKWFTTTVNLVDRCINCKKKVVKPKD